MSKFIDRLNRLSRGDSTPIGFRSKQTESPKPKIQLVYRLGAEEAESLTDDIAGVDALIVRISVQGTGTEVYKEISAKLKDTTWGIQLTGASGKGMIVSTGGDDDFAVLRAADTPLLTVENDEPGRILEVEASTSEGLLRTINDLPVDAVLLTTGEKEISTLTWQHLMLYHHFADLLTKPLLVSVPVKVTAGEIKALWEAGVKGVVIEVTAKTPKGSLKKLRQAIDRLDFPSPRRGERPGALLPGSTNKQGTITEEEEDEE